MKSKITVTAEYELEGETEQQIKDRENMLRNQFANPLSPGTQGTVVSFKFEHVSDDGIPVDFACYDTPEGIHANYFLTALCRRLCNEVKGKDSQSGAYISLRNCFCRYLNATQFSGKESGMWDTEPRNKLLNFAEDIVGQHGYHRGIVREAFEAAQF